MDGKPAMRPPRRPPLPSSKRSAVWLVGLLVALCFFTLPLLLALSRGRPNLSDVSKMSISVTARHGTYVRAWTQRLYVHSLTV